ITRALFAAADHYADKPLFIVPANPARAYAAEGCALTYAEVAYQVEKTMLLYQEAGYGFPHRVALLLDNRPEHIIHKLALNALGVCCVPVNPSYRAQELAYLFDHSQPELIV